jgi:hypothetical protein
VPVFDPAAGWQGIRDFFAALSFSNYATMFSDSLYLAAYLRSLQIATISTLLLLVIAYPLAYGIARAPRRAQSILVMSVILPFLTAFLIRIYAWMNLLQPEGLVNNALIALGLVRTPVEWLASDTAIYIISIPIAVHGAAALCRARKDGRNAARSCRRPRMPVVEGILARHRTAFAPRRNRGRYAVFHSDCRRVRHPRSARRFGIHDDRPDAVERILRNRDWPVAPLWRSCCYVCCWRRSCITSIFRCANSKVADPCARAFPFST